VERGGSTPARNATADVALCTAGDAGEDVQRQGLMPARGRVPHLLGREEKSLQPPEPKPPRAGSGLPNPRRRVALAAPEATFAPSSTSPDGRSSPPPARVRPRQLYSSAGRSSSPPRHAGQLGPLWPVLEVWRFRISTAPVTLPGPAHLPPPSRRSCGPFQLLAGARAQVSESNRSPRSSHWGSPPSCLPTSSSS
jgi:hypothetical protein